jgi:hypothetical protein
MAEYDDLKKIAQEEAGWLRQRKKKAAAGSNENYAIPAGERDPATTPLGTDQEAGGAITTPEGNRRYS